MQERKALSCGVYWNCKQCGLYYPDQQMHNTYIYIYIYIHTHTHTHRVLNLKVDHQLSPEYFMSDAIYNGSAGMTYIYMCRSWQDCCRRGENWSWPSVSVESVDSECWCVWTTPFLRFHNALNSGRTCIYFGKLFKNDVLRPTVDKVSLKNLEFWRWILLVPSKK